MSDNKYLIVLETFSGSTVVVNGSDDFCKAQRMLCHHQKDYPTNNYTIIQTQESGRDE